MINEKLKLNFPVDGGDVFDRNNNDIFFCYSGQFSNTTNNLNGLSVKEFEKYIPTGYKSIFLCKRVRLYSKGKNVAEFRQRLGDKFVLLTKSEYKLFVPSWKREIETTTIYKPNSIDLSIYSSIWDNYENCAEFGERFSEINDCDVIVATVIEVINWH